MSDAPDDAALMRLSAAGDDRAFAEIVRRHQDVLLNFFIRSSVSYADAQDLAQRSFLRLWRYRSRYRAQEAKFTTFLFLVARQVSIDFFRAESSRRQATAGLAAEGGEVAYARSSRSASAGPNERLVRALGRLSGVLREAVELVVFQRLAYAEAATVLQVPVGTVKSRVSNALKRLKELMGNER